MPDEYKAFFSLVNRLERQADNLQLPIAEINNSLSYNFAIHGVVLN
jgi:hypothetical protein